MRLALAVLALVLLCSSGLAADFVRLPVAEYRDHMEAGWLGQIAGVAWGGAHRVPLGGTSSPPPTCRPGTMTDERGLRPG